MDNETKPGKLPQQIIAEAMDAVSVAPSTIVGDCRVGKAGPITWSVTPTGYLVLDMCRAHTDGWPLSIVARLRVISRENLNFTHYAAASGPLSIGDWEAFAVCLAAVKGVLPC